MIKNEKGFTLIELMLATAILVISIIPITMMLPRMLTENRIVERENRAVFLGQLKMEETKTKALTYFNSDYSVTSATAFQSPDNKFKYTVADNYGLDIKDISVTVWYDANDDNTLDSDEERIQFKTKIANRGLRRT